MTDKPLHVADHIQTGIGINDGSVDPTCFHCGVNPCYALSFQKTADGQEFWVRTVLYDEKHLVCVECYNFMNRNGKWLTFLLRKALKVNILLRRRK